MRCYMMHKAHAEGVRTKQLPCPWKLPIDVLPCLRCKGIVLLKVLTRLMADATA